MGGVQFEKWHGVPIYVDSDGEFHTPGEDDSRAAGIASFYLGLRAPTLAEIRRKIDKAEKTKFERFTVWKDRGWRHDDFRKVTVTSVQEDGSLWITDSNKHREKMYKTDTLYLDTPENAELVQAIRDHRKQIRTWERRIEALTKQMKTWTNPKA